MMHARGVPFLLLDRFDGVRRGSQRRSRDGNTGPFHDSNSGTARLRTPTPRARELPSYFRP